jgi:ornithine cyclodeaminase/alanine dehydrogenase-like protein (mu-crystallin family)
LPLVLSAEVVRGLIDPAAAMQALAPLMIEEAAGTTFHMPPYGANRLKTFRVVGGGLQGMGRMGLRSAEAVLLFDRQEPGKILAIVGGDMADLRIGATLALAATYLARADATAVALLGSGRRALILLQCLKEAHPIERVAVFSPTVEHRESFADRAAAALELPVIAASTTQAATAEADIVVVATNSRRPVVAYADLHSGQHVTSMGAPGEIDESILLNADQIVAPSRDEEIDRSNPAVFPHNEGPLWRLIQDGRLDPASIVELGSIITGDVAPRNGPTDINLFRDARGGIGDVALASWVYDRARERGLGIEVEL